MKYRYNSPPNWPTPPPGWEPADDWRPDTSWGPAPPGWQFWVPVEGDQVTERLDVLNVGEMVKAGIPRKPGSKGTGSDSGRAGGGAGTTRAADEPPRRGHRGLIILVAVALVVIVVGAILLNQVKGDTDRTSSPTNSSTQSSAPTTTQTSAPPTTTAPPTSPTSEPPVEPSTSGTPTGGEPTDSREPTRSGEPSEPSTDASPSTSSASPTSSTSNLNISLTDPDYGGNLGSIYPETARQSSSSLGTIQTEVIKAEWVTDPQEALADGPTPRDALLVFTVRFVGQSGTYLPNTSDFQVMDISGTEFRPAVGYTLKQPITPVALTGGREFFGQVAFDVPEGAYDLVFTMHSAKAVQWHITL